LYDILFKGCLTVGVEIVQAVEPFPKSIMTVEGKISPISSILRKSIYIIKRIIIIIGEILGKKEVEELYKDAIVLHLLREGYSEYMAEAEARRRMMRNDEF
jgi:hypothetical protein